MIIIVIIMKIEISSDTEPNQPAYQCEPARTNTGVHFSGLGNESRENAMVYLKQLTRAPVPGRGMEMH